MSWIENATISITYEQLQEDVTSTILRVFNEMDIKDIDKKIVEEATHLSTFKKIKQLEITKGKDDRANQNLEKNFKFARKGSVGQWKEYFTRNDIEYIIKVLNKYGITKYYEYYS